MFNFYVYAYLRLDGTPYYIGKGKRSRAWGKHTTVKCPKDKNRIVILESNLSNIGALALERRYIRWWGRKDNGTGILHNRTDGGEGTAGIIQTEEHKRKVSIAKTGKKASEKTKQKMRKPKSKEHLENLAKTISFDWILTDPNGKSFHIKNLKKFCRENNLHNGHLIGVAKGRNEHHKKWKCSYFNMANT